MMFKVPLPKNQIYKDLEGLAIPVISPTLVSIEMRTNYQIHQFQLSYLNETNLLISQFQKYTTTEPQDLFPSNLANHFNLMFQLLKDSNANFYSIQTILSLYEFINLYDFNDKQCFIEIFLMFQKKAKENKSFNFISWNLNIDNFIPLFISFFQEKNDIHLAFINLFSLINQTELPLCLSDYHYSTLKDFHLHQLIIQSLIIPDGLVSNFETDMIYNTPEIIHKNSDEFGRANI